MLFTHSTFLFYFLPFALLVHRVANAFGRGREYPHASRLCLFVLTAIFYGARNPWWLAPFFACIAFDFLWSRLLVATETPRRRRLVVSLSVAQNLGLLGYFKYWDFLVGLVPQGTWLAGWLSPHGLELPPGISFYTFESLSYVIDVYRRHVTPPKHPLEFFAFIGMFPRFVAGPIVRYREMVDQFRDYRGMQLTPGLFLFAIGFFYKLCFADSFSVFTRYAFGEGSPGFSEAWTGVFAYTMQIYFDFAGYSLMAIGLGRCLGFVFPANFRVPYLSTSLQEFWRRWHISLSTWLRDYLYVSLGGSRRGTVRTYVNLMLTMGLGGLWHGAGLTFLAWGLWHGACLCLERVARFPLRAASPIVARAIVLVLVMIGWVFFRAASLEEATILLTAMGSPLGGLALNPEPFRIYPLATALSVLGLVHAFWIEPRIRGILEGDAVSFRIPAPAQLGAAGAFVVAIVVGFSQGQIPFLYFQF